MFPLCALFVAGLCAWRTYELYQAKPVDPIGWGSVGLFGAGTIAGLLLLIPAL